MKNKNKNRPILGTIITIISLIIFVAGVILVTEGVFTFYIKKIPYYSFLFKEYNYKASSGTANDEVMNWEKNFYIPHDFPVIYLNDVWASLTIDDIGVNNVPVFFGDSDENLTKGIGQFAGSRFCGQDGNIVLSGHVTTPFNKLQDIQIGTLVNMDTIYGKYVYKVEDTQIFNYEDASLLMPSDGEEKLTIYTCYPNNHPTAFKTERFAVICSKVSGKDWINGGN